jgi:putative PIG3 family NAD(P)H quinone oxidoreductase
MRVVEIAAFGPADGLQLAERPDPVPGPGEILIDVAAAGVNRPDVLQRYGKYAPPPGASDIPGLEVAGTVGSLGAGVTTWRVGELVCALVSGGGYATKVAVPVEQCLPVPDGLSLIEAAALPETFFTVWTNVFDRAALARGQTLLVHGGTSGIGTTAIQLAVAWGAGVYATAGTPEKCDACRALGATDAFNYRTDDWVTAVKSATAGRGVDVVLDMVGGDYVAKNIDVLALEGTLVQIAFLKSPRVELDLSLVMRKRLWITGSTLRLRARAARHPPGVATRRRRRRAPAHGVERAHRQDRARCPRLIRSSPRASS